MIISCSEKKIGVYPRYSVLAWLFKFKTVDGECLNNVGGAHHPQERLDEGKRSQIKTPSVSLEMVSSDHIEHLRFRKNPQEKWIWGRCLYPFDWEIVAATGHFLEKATVKKAEYSGLAKGMQSGLTAYDPAAPRHHRLHPPHLLRLLQEPEKLQSKFKPGRLVHVKRYFNAAADYVSKRFIQNQLSLEVTSPGEIKLLRGLDQIHAQLIKDSSPREQ
ncbi:hypothetical protein PHMEG_0005214 [Phytophthora megakarya]|uniref:Uncharacterized protein n=1 Tax=Phytophthora megakarya TaxID=4795 RepID=A0A225WRV6_9STRA|nr:hypothetical protein PHMEG_0005214 [Phytophthora megakarya]